MKAELRLYVCRSGVKHLIRCPDDEKPRIANCIRDLTDCISEISQEVIQKPVDSFGVIDIRFIPDRHLKYSIAIDEKYSKDISSAQRQIVLTLKNGIIEAFK